MAIEFITTFVNSVGVEVAGTLLDEGGRWKLSTVPLQHFQSQEEAIAFFHAYCDPETGMQCRNPFRNDLLQKLHREVNRGKELRDQCCSLAQEVNAALGQHRSILARMRDRAKTNPL
jgi:hypothetical protein